MTAEGVGSHPRLGRLLRTTVWVTGVCLAVASVPGPWRSTAAGGGVAVLLSAPYLATLSAAVLYGRRRSWRNAALSLLLLVLLLAGLWLGTGPGG